MTDQTPTPRGREPRQALHGGLAPARRGRARPRGRRCLAHDRAGRDARPRRRVGQRQVNGRSCIVRLLEPTAGTIRLKGQDITHISRRELRPLRREMHIVFQDPYSSLNPRMTCGDIVGEPLRIQHLSRGRSFDGHVRDLSTRSGSVRSCATAIRTSSRVAASARRARARAFRLAVAADRGRARVGARRLRAGGDPQPDARASARHGVLVPVHHTRPRNGRIPVRSRRGDVPRPDRRDRAHVGALRVAEASVHAGAALRGGRAGSRYCSGREPGSCSTATFRRRSRRRPAAASARAARSSPSRRRARTTRSRRWSTSATGTSSRAISSRALATTPR